MVNMDPTTLNEGWSGPVHRIKNAISRRILLRLLSPFFPALLHARARSTVKARLASNEFTGPPLEAASRQVHLFRPSFLTRQWA